MKNQYLVIGVVILIIIGGALFFFSRNQSQIQETPQETSQEFIPSGETQEITVETIELKPVGVYTGFGTASRDFNGKTFTHLVTAKLGDPSEGKFYEGWLVKKEPTLNFFSTGKLERKGGDFVLLFTDNQDYPDYKDVVITEETENLGQDGNPEAHVLEGTFQKN